MVDDADDSGLGGVEGQVPAVSEAKGRCACARRLANAVEARAEALRGERQRFCAARAGEHDGRGGGAVEPDDVHREIGGGEGGRPELVQEAMISRSRRAALPAGITTRSIERSLAASARIAKTSGSEFGGR